MVTIVLERADLGQDLVHHDTLLVFETLCNVIVKINPI